MIIRFANVFFVILCPSKNYLINKSVYRNTFMLVRRMGLTILFASGFLACKRQLIEASLPANQSVPITVAINQNQKGYHISSTFQGLSFETGLLTESPDYLSENNTVLVQLIKNLGPGILRIGGNRSDEINWVGDTEVADTARNSLTTAEIDRLSAFSQAIKWQVLFGLNLANNDVNAAADEAHYLNQSLQRNLYALQSGNEPDVFYPRWRPVTYNYNKFQKEWEGYFSAIKKSAPTVRFAGPDVDPFDPWWFSSFAENEQKNVRILDAHYYNTGPASDPSITYHNILTPSRKLDGFLVQLNKISASCHLPYRLSECNSVYGGGKKGVSDAFAASLWALDFMWVVAENNGQGVNFHGGTSRFAYTPIAVDHGTAAARPEYYAMLAFKHGAIGGTIIPATIADPRDYNNCSIYACANTNNTYSITLINKEDKKDFAFTVQLNKTATNIKIARLAAPDITSTTGVTFAGSSVNTDGTFTPQTIEQYAINGKSFVINVPAGSAAVVTVQ